MLFYEGRLRSRPNLDTQAIVDDTPFADAGLWFVPVDHERNKNAPSIRVESGSHRSNVGSRG